MATSVGGIVLGDLVLGASTSGAISRSVTSTLTLSHSISSTFNQIDQTLSLSHTIDLSRVLNRDVTSTLTLTQNINVVKPESAESTLSLTHDVDYTVAKIWGVSQSLSFNQTIEAPYVAARLVVSGIEWTHTRDYDAVFNRPPDNTLTFSQTIVAHACKHVPTTLTFSQTIDYVKIKHMQHTLEWQQEVIRNVNYVRPINTVLGISQQFTKTARLNKTVTQGLALGQTIVQARVKGVTQTLNFTQTIVAHAVKNVTNILTFSQAISYNHVANRTVGHSLNLVQTPALARTHSKEIHHGFGMNSVVSKSKISTASVEQTITFVSETPKELTRESLSDALTLDHTVGYTPIYPRSVSSVLEFSQTVGLNKVVNESITSTLAFLPNRQVYIGMGEVEYYLVDNVQYALVPAYLQGKKNRPMCVLQTNNSAITLPAPEFGDAENFGGLFTIRRSMNNIPYTHVRTLSLRKLNLPFVLAKRKAWELREFLIANNSKVMTLTTWKGDKWFVNLTTNPVELSVRGRYFNEDEKVSIELEFEGFKVM